MRYPPHILDEIRARLPASDVIGRRVRLKKAGREWRGLSPFNAEKTPSFYVNDQKQFYHCFSSGKHGDVFTFLMETEGVSFPEAVERLAGEAGVALPAPSSDDEASANRRKGALEAMELAAAYFEAQLAGRAGAAARAYLDRRALGAGVRAQFRLGYAPGERFALRDHLAAKGIDKALMVELGLLVSGEDISVPYDRFRDRVIFPICDLRGRVIAFGGRAMQAEAKAKYLNSPETPLFQKGRLLYNLHRARQPAHTRKSIIAVEGYIDVIAMTLAGRPETVAPLGTALTEDQLGLLWRQADEPILCFDGDAAGQRAAFRALDLALPMLEPGRSLRFAMLPQGQDPDDLLRTGGPAAIDTVLEGARPLVEMLWSRAELTQQLGTPERNASFAQSIRKDISNIKNNDVREFYSKAINAGIREAIEGAYKTNKSNLKTNVKISYRSKSDKYKFIDFKFDPVLKANKGDGANPAFIAREAMIVLSLLAHPDLLFDGNRPHGGLPGLDEEAFAELELENADARALRSLLIERASDGEDAPEAMRLRIARAGLTEATNRLAALVRQGDRWALDPQADRQRLETTLAQAVNLHRKAGALHSELRQAERALVADESEANFAWLCDVKERLAVIAGADAETELPEMDG